MLKVVIEYTRRSVYNDIIMVAHFNQKKGISYVL